MIRRLVMFGCLALALAFAALWYLSHRRADLCFYREHNPLAVMIFCVQGQLRVSLWYSGERPRTAISAERAFLHFGSKVAINTTPLNTVNHLRRICVPLALPLGFFLACFAIMLIRGPLRMRWRRKHNCCLRCGYSLDGLTEPRCPECGREMESFVGEPDDETRSSLGQFEGPFQQPSPMERTSGAAAQHVNEQ